MDWMTATEQHIYLFRHTQAEHNLSSRYHIHDPPLTKLGVLQAQHIEKNHSDIMPDLIVCSPLRRTVQTCLLAFGNRISGETPLIILPQLQETSSNPCDTGSDRVQLEKDFPELDFSLLTDDWTRKEGFYSPSKVNERALWVRKWLKERTEKRIVVVGHASFLQFMLENPQAFANGEGRLYTFVDEVESNQTTCLLRLKSE